MTHAQSKSCEILTPLVGEYLATKLSTRLPAVLVDKLSAELQKRIQSGYKAGYNAGVESCLSGSDSAGSPDTPGTSDR